MGFRRSSGIIYLITLEYLYAMKMMTLKRLEYLVLVTLLLLPPGNHVYLAKISQLDICAGHWYSKRACQKRLEHRSETISKLLDEWQTIDEKIGVARFRPTDWEQLTNSEMLALSLTWTLLETYPKYNTLKICEMHQADTPRYWKKEIDINVGRDRKPRRWNFLLAKEEP